MSKRTGISDSYSLLAQWPNYKYKYKIYVIQTWISEVGLITVYVQDTEDLHENDSSTLSVSVLDMTPKINICPSGISRGTEFNAKIRSSF